MKRQLKRAGIYVIALSLFFSAADFVFADGAVKTINMNEVSTQKPDLEHSLSEMPFIPSGYTASTIFALSMAIEQVNNPRASVILQRNIDLAIAKWEQDQELQKQRDKLLTAEKRKKALAAKERARSKGKSKGKGKKAHKVAVASSDDKEKDDKKLAKAAEKEAEKAKEEAEKAEEKAEKEAKKANKKKEKEEEKKRKKKRDKDDGKDEDEADKDKPDEDKNEEGGN